MIELSSKHSFIHPNEFEEQLYLLGEIFGELPDYNGSRSFKKKSKQLENQTKEGILKRIRAPYKDDKLFVDFISKMLHLDPANRWTAAKLLNHRWLK